MTIIERNKQQAAIEQALKLAFIKLQQTDGFRPIEGSKVPDMQAYIQILDAIRAFDPGFRFGKDPVEAYRDAISIAITVDRVRKEQIKISTGVTEEDQQSSFQNATLQGSGIAFSIATFVRVPDAIADNEAEVEKFIRHTLAPAVSADLSFEVQTGPAR